MVCVCVCFIFSVLFGVFFCFCLLCFCVSFVLLVFVLRKTSRKMSDRVPKALQNLRRKKNETRSLTSTNYTIFVITKNIYIEPLHPFFVKNLIKTHLFCMFLLNKNQKLQIKTHQTKPKVSLLRIKNLIKTTKTSPKNASLLRSEPLCFGPLGLLGSQPPRCFGRASGRLQRRALEASRRRRGRRWVVFEGLIFLGFPRDITDGIILVFFPAKKQRSADSSLFVYYRSFDTQS